MLPFVSSLPEPWRMVVYVLTFLRGLFLLERDADWLVDGVAALTRRLRAPRTVVGLLMAGEETT
jgi:Ca2+/Na+ antiporter